MKRLVAIGLGILLAGAAAMAPAVAGPERRTETVDDGKAVDSLLIRYHFEGSWVLDDQNILLRDTYREHYLLTLKEPCGWIELSNPFTFYPELKQRVRADRSYEVRDNQHIDCDIARIEKVSSDRAKELRAKLAD